MWEKNTYCGEGAILKERQTLLKLLTSLAANHYGTTTLTRLAKQTGFLRASDPRFKECIADLEKEGILSVQQSGFKGHSMEHHKIVVLRADVMFIHESEILPEKKESPQSIIYFQTEEDKKERALGDYLPSGISLLMSRFFQLALNKKYAPAERMLRNIKRRLPRSQYGKGLFMALSGMLVTLKSTQKGNYEFLHNIDFKDTKKLHNNRMEFLRRAKNKRNGLYDRGYFLAWADLMRILIKKGRVNEE